MALALLAGAAPLRSAAAMVSPFLNRREVNSRDLSPFTKWTGMLRRYDAQRDDAQGPVAARWDAFVRSEEGKPLAQQVREVNRFFNAVRYIEDQANYGQADYWATPYEFLARGGDCEDYAIAKYLTLKRLGVDPDQMRLMIVQDYNLGGIIHCILEVTVDGERLILDNQARDVMAAAQIFHYQPVYAINESSWWAFK